MSWSYDNDTLNKTTSIGRKNSVRYLVGDTDDCNQMVQDEEILFSLSESNGNIYYAASEVAMALSSKFSIKVDTELDGAIKSNYSTLSKQYHDLASRLKQKALMKSGSALGVKAGGLSILDMTTNDENTDRVKPSFTKGQFDIDKVHYSE